MPEPILCVGECLWDALPAGLFLGGAPFNVACHLRPLGEDVLFASRLGGDELGREIIRRMERRGLSTELMQTDPDLETGFVIVDLDASGSPSFEIVHPSAWDAVELTEPLAEAASASRAVVFGSLAQRDPRSRQTIQTLLGRASFRVFDINLRPPFDDRAVVEASLPLSDLVKLNDAELKTLAEWFGLPKQTRDGAEALADRFGLRSVCVTRGEGGAALLTHGEWYDHPGCRVTVADAVGAGDAFLAGMLSQMLADKPPAESLAFANALGALVASRNGATPEVSRREIDDFMAGAEGP